jgi:phosphatidylethanolamine-binding protein (PEBP) family uncharacterized protein
MAGNPDMAGQYFGYDGPCPPWNDERMHHYIFTIYALDIDKSGPADRASMVMMWWRRLVGMCLIVRS